MLKSLRILLQSKAELAAQVDALQNQNRELIHRCAHEIQVNGKLRARYYELQEVHYKLQRARLMDHGLEMNSPLARNLLGFESA